MKTLSNKLLLTLSCITFSVMANDASSINSYEDPNKETAAALVSEYERVFLTEGFFTEDDYEWE